MPDFGSKNLAQLFDSMAVPRANMAVVSPCSQCRNQREESKDGKPSCPRRALAKYKRDLEANDVVPDSTLELVTITGSENTDSPDTLVNPVYSDDKHTILVWAAHLRDNQGVTAEDGSQLTPSILEEGFDTDYIVCNPRPYVVRDTEANYFLRGAYRGFDTLEAVSVQDQQLLRDGEDLLSSQLEGFAHKVDFAYRFNRKKLEKDLTPRGT